MKFFAEKARHIALPNSRLNLIMSSLQAQNLNEVSRVIGLDPLEPGDLRYADLSKARSTRDLSKLRVYLENSADNSCWASAAFIGHRGSGKSTELKRLEGELAGKFTSLHLTVDNSLQADCDYTDLLLWLVDSIVSFYKDQGLPLDGDKAKAVADWFTERTIETADALKSEIQLETDAEVKSEAGANVNFLVRMAYSVKLLARLKARLVGNRDHRKLARQRLQNYSDELIVRVNELLAHAREVLVKKNRPGQLLIIQDNLDRLGRDAALRLFRDNGDFLKRIEAHCIWTVPINSRLSPFGIHNLFNNIFSMPTIKVHNRAGNKVEDGIQGLVNLVAKRINISTVFSSPEVVALLAEKSGGSVRDLLRLVGEAQLAAQVDGKTVIDEASAREAIKKLRLDFQGLFVPGDVYYPLLAAVAHTKEDAVPRASTSPEQADSNRTFFAELLVNGSILEYNGDERWFDIHPVVHDIDAFKNACKAPKPGKAERK